MGKMKRPASVAESTDENDGGWLSTRNKKKISPPPIKTRGGNHLLRRPVPRSPLVALMDDTPVALKTTKKQTCIADFFCPRLQGLPPRAEGEHTEIHQVKSIKEEQTSQWGDGDEMYEDFDMPGPTPTPTAKYGSQKSLSLDFDMPAPTPSPSPSQVNPESSEVNDHSPSAVLPPEASSPTKTSQPTSWEKSGHGSSHNQTPFCDHVGKGMENGEEKVTLCEVTSKSASRRDRFLGCVGQSLRSCDSLKTHREVCPLQEESTQCLGCTEHRAEDAGLVAEAKEENHLHRHIVSEAKEENHLHKHLVSEAKEQNHLHRHIVSKAKEENHSHRQSAEPNCKISTAGDDDTFPDSLHTPPFLNEVSHTLHFSHLPEAAGTLSTWKTDRVESRSFSRRGDPQLKTAGSQGTQEKGNLLGDFTELNSLQFTGDDSQQDTQQQCSSGQQSAYGTVNRKTLEQSLTTSNSHEEPTDSLQTPDFLSLETAPEDSQQTERWGRKSPISGKFRVGDVSPDYCGDDLQTPGFLRGLGEDSSSGDLC